LKNVVEEGSGLQLIACTAALLSMRLFKPPG